MRLFPVFLDLEGRSCLVVGGGAAGLSKARRLVSAGASVLVVDPAPGAELMEAARILETLHVEARAFRDGDVVGRLLVFACTGDAAVDAAVAAAACRAEVLCCRADGADGDFTTGAVLERGDLCIALSTGGAAPSLAVYTRDRLASVVGEEYGEAAAMIAALRSRLRDAVPDEGARATALREAASGRLLDALASGRRDDAVAVVDAAFEAACRRSGTKGITPGEGTCTR